MIFWCEEGWSSSDGGFIRVVGIVEWGFFWFVDYIVVGYGGDEYGLGGYGVVVGFWFGGFYVVDWWFFEYGIRCFYGWFVWVEYDDVRLVVCVGLLFWLVICDYDGMGCFFVYWKCWFWLVWVFGGSYKCFFLNEGEEGCCLEDEVWGWISGVFGGDVVVMFVCL